MSYDFSLDDIIRIATLAVSTWSAVMSIIVLCLVVRRRPRIVSTGFQPSRNTREVILSYRRRARSRMPSSNSCSS